MIFSILLAVFLLAALYLVMPGRPSEAQRRAFQFRSYAHRGLYTADQSTPENSLAAFEAAARQGYGIELDVQLSRDGQVVVFHDAALDRMTGLQGRVQDFTGQQLNRMQLCGTGQTIPLLAQVLDTVAGRSPLIVELKSGSRNRELCSRTLALLRSYPGAFCIESFDPTIVAWFRRNAPDILRGQLSHSAGRTLSPKRYLLSRCLGNCLARPQFIAWGSGKKNLPVRLAEGLGAMKIHWTVRSGAELEALQAEYDALIFEFCSAPVQW